MKNTIFKIIIILLIFFILFLIIRNTYSKYVTTQDSFTQSNISRWHILLNDNDISKNKDFSDFIDIKLDKNDHITENVIVPTSKGHIDLSLESTGTELAFEYEIGFLKEPSDLPDFKIYAYSLNDEEIINITEKSFPITGIVEPAVDAEGKFTNEQVINNFVLYVEWYDDLDNIFDNANDVKVSKTENAIFQLPLHIKIAQIYSNSNDTNTIITNSINKKTP